MLPPKYNDEKNCEKEEEKKYLNRMLKSHGNVAHWKIVVLLVTLWLSWFLLSRARSSHVESNNNINGHNDKYDLNYSGCSTVLLISHRAAIPASLGEDTSSRPPGSVEAAVAIMQRGICAFDVDLFLTADEVLVVGHPAEVQHRLALSTAPTALTLDELRSLDRGKTATVFEFLRAIVEQAPSMGACWRERRKYGGASAKATPLRVLLEPKGNAATSQSVRTIAEAARAGGLRNDEVGVWVSEPAVAAVAVRTGMLTPLLAIKSSAGLKKPPRGDVWAAVGPPINFAALSAFTNVTHGQNQAVFTWVVDTKVDLKVAMDASVEGIISNEPFHIAKELSSICPSWHPV